MYENGEKINRHANVIKHKRRLKDTQWFFLTDRQKLYVDKNNDKWYAYNVNRMPYTIKWWHSIYDPWYHYNQTSKKQASRRVRNFYKDQLNKYLADEDFDYINQDLKCKL